MDKMRLGRTGIMASRSGFGAIPIQRIGAAESTALLRKAREGGINFFDTARGYTDSEEKIGLALSDLRKELFLATKTPAQDGVALVADLELSLKSLRTDYIDVYQLHNPAFVPKPGDGTGLYEASRRRSAREDPLPRHHEPPPGSGARGPRIGSLRHAAVSLQLPLVGRGPRARPGGAGEGRRLHRDEGSLGGLITNAASAFAFIRSHEGVLPIWGIEREAQLDDSSPRGLSARPGRRDARSHRARPRRALRLLLPRLRLLPPLSRRDRD